MDDKKLKDMWTNLNEYLDKPIYASQNIERFINKKSFSISSKIKENFIINLVIRILASFALIVNTIFYYQHAFVPYFCVFGLIIITFLIYYDLKSLKYYNRVIDRDKNAKDKLKDMLQFLNQNTQFMIMSTAASYLIAFPAFILLYFFLVYGQIKPMPPFGFAVFGIIHIIGIAYSIIYNSSQLKFHTKHIEACLAEFDDETKVFITQEIEEKRKQDANIKVLLYIVVLLVFIVLIAILKKFGL